MKAPSSSRIIGAESLSGVRRFTLSDLGEPQLEPERPAEASDPAFEAGREQGLREGLRQGLEAAREQAAREAARRDEQAVEGLTARTARLSAALEAQFAALSGAVADELVDLAIEIARQTVHRAIDADREALVGLAQEAIAALLDERSSFTLHVNPADKPLLDHALGETLAARGARLVPDPTITAGGCKLMAATAEVDATLETRWRRVIAAMGRTAPPLPATETR